MQSCRILQLRAATCMSRTGKAARQVRKCLFSKPENEYSFSARYEPLGENGKYKAHILKYVPCILK